MDRTPQTLSMAYAKALVDAAGLTAAQAARLLSAPDGSGGVPARFDDARFAQLYRHMVVLLDDEMLGFFSRPLRPGALKYTCLAVMDARNLGVALHRWAWMYRVIQDDVSLEMTTADGLACLTVVEAGEAVHAQPFAIDLLLKLVHGVGSWLTGRRLPLVRVDFHFPRPPHAADFEVLYPGPVRFDQPRSALVFDAAQLQLPVRRTRQQLDEFLLRAPEDWLFARSRRPARLTLRLRDHFTAQMPRPVTAEGAAEALAVSLRTLHRHLADEGTSFQRVKDEFRRDRAMEMLAKTPWPIRAIGEQLGFESLASFHRAFRGWTGRTPGDYRKGAGSV